MHHRPHTYWTRLLQGRGVGTGGATGARAPPIFCALALAAASHVRTTRNATGDLYLRRHNCPKCPQNIPKNCLKSQILWGGMPPDSPRLAALRPILAPPVIFIFLRPCKGRRSRTRGRSQCVLAKIWRSTWNTYLVLRLNVVVR